MDIVDQLKSLTTYTCYECCSSHTMFYYANTYSCEECYRLLPFHEVNYSDEDFNIDWKGVKKLIRDHDDPRDVIRAFILEIQREEIDEDQIDELLYELHHTNLFLGH